MRGRLNAWAATGPARLSHPPVTRRANLSSALVLALAPERRTRAACEVRFWCDARVDEAGRLLPVLPAALRTPGPG